MTTKPTATRARTQGDKGQPFRPRETPDLNARGTCNELTGMQISYASYCLGIYIYSSAIYRHMNSAHLPLPRVPVPVLTVPAARTGTVEIRTLRGGTDTARNFNTNSFSHPLKGDLFSDGALNV